MSNAGSALMGIGTAMGDKRAELAAKAAINSPLLEVSIAGAKGVLFSIAGSEDLGMLEVQDAANVITEAIDPEAKVIFGAVTDETLKKGQVRVTVIATGFPETQSRPNLFQPRVLPRKDDNTPVPSMKSEPKAEQKPEPKRIIDSAVSDKKQPEVKRPAAEPAKPAAAAPKPASSSDEDSWGGLPSFLRRK
jgi:cell division protein FtsZ